MIVKCYTCQQEFDKPDGEYNRSEKLGRRHFCSLRCCGKVNQSHLVLPKGTKCPWLKPDNQLDEYSPFRPHLNSIRRRSKIKNKKPDLTLKYLKEVWENQKGICPYTGWELKLRPSTSCTKDDKTPNLASIDRIDNNRWYEKGNIQFVAYIANLAKNEWPEDQFMNLCESVARHKGLVR